MLIKESENNMPKQKDNEIELRVAEAQTRDVGRGIARVDSEIISKMGLCDWRCN